MFTDQTSLPLPLRALSSRISCPRRTRPAVLMTVCVMLLRAAMAGPVVGGTLFLDDFGDGDAEDGSPVSWERLPGSSNGAFDASSGDFVLESNNGEDPLVAFVPGLTLQGTSIRTQARANGPTSVAVAGRGDPNRQVTYQGGISSITGNLYLGRNDPFELFVAVPSEIKVDEEDVTLQLDIFGNMLSLYSWRPGHPMPAEPQVTFVDDRADRLDSGTVGLIYDPTNAATATYRFLQVADTPIRDANSPPALQPGDADQDLDFDQLDLVQVQVGSKYLTGQPATWGEGDWDGGPGGARGTPPAGDGMFDQRDIVRALAAGQYLAGPYAAVPGPAEAGSGVFDSTFGASVGSVSYGDVAQASLSKEHLATGMTVVGFSTGGGALGTEDLVAVPVPEPGTVVLVGIGLLGLLRFRRL